VPALLTAQDPTGSPGVIALQIEDLMDVNVTSASKKEWKISQVAAAVIVISEGEMRGLIEADATTDERQSGKGKDDWPGAAHMPGSRGDCACL
jgi:hypothetical protein